MRVYDAYRRNIITQGQYAAIIEAGFTDSDTYYSAMLAPTSDDPANVTGTTTNTSTTVIASDTHESTVQTVVVENTGDTNTLSYTIQFYAADLLYNTITGTVTPSDVFMMRTRDAVTLIALKVASTSAGNHTTYEAAIVAA